MPTIDHFYLYWFLKIHKIIISSPATASSLGCLIKIVVDKLFLFILEVAEVQLIFLLVRTNVSEKHVAIPLFKLIARVLHVEGQVVLVLSIALPVLYE